MKKEFCIMPKSPYYAIERFYGSERHEVFEGRTSNREKSIKDGLVIFLSPDQHRNSKTSIHQDPRNPKWVEVKKIAQKRWQEYYSKTTEDFIKRYGKSYI